MSSVREPIPDHQLLKAGEVAAVFGVTITSINYHLRRGRFPNAFRNPGMGLAPGRWRIPRDDVERVARECGVQP